MVKFLEPNAEPIPGYRLLRYLGRGGFGEVWETTAPGGLSKAIKIAPLDGTSGANSRELEGLQKIRSIRHPYLLSIERFEVVDDYLIIIMELADKTLADRFEECVYDGKPGIPRAELLHYLREASEVLDLMNNEHGLQHLDIKPRNLFLSGGHVKVADFGLVQPRNTNLNPSAIAISPPYAPPELFYGRIEPTADQYSLAVTYQELMTGYRPYTATDVRTLIYQHLKERPDLSPLPQCDRPILGRALQRDVTKRYASCTEFCRALLEVEVDEVSLVAVRREPAARVGEGLTERSEIIVTRTVPGDTPGGPGSTGVADAKRHHVRPRGPLSPRTPSVANTTTVTNVPGMLAQLMGTSGTGDTSSTIVPVTDQVEATFVAFLPLEIFAHKLRGFIDALEGEIISCSDESTVLRFRSRGWFGFRSPKGIFMELTTCCVGRNSGFRVVNANVWSTSRHLQGPELGRRGILLIQCLKAYLMAMDSPKNLRPLTAAEVRSRIFG